MPPKFLWRSVTNNSHPEAAETIRRFLEIEQCGSKVLYFSCDVSEHQRLMRIIHYVQNALGPITGIVHAAGVGGKSRLARHSVDSFRETLLPKIHGTIALYELVDRRKLEFFICFSSLNAIVGVDREINYSAANAFLDGFASRLNREGVLGISIRWPFWTETGMGHRLRPFEEVDVVPEIAVTNDEGLRIFKCLLKNGFRDVLITKKPPSAMPGNHYFVSRDVQRARGPIPTQQ
ncbi:MAG: SDR family NAD(P)-dependent oxidoreductase, partial [Flammeovirgaceae bacterium]